MKKLLVSFVFGFMFAVCSVNTGDAHPDKREYEACRDKCKARFEVCYKRDCADLPEGKRSACWMRCAAKPEVKECYESCDEHYPG